MIQPISTTRAQFLDSLGKRAVDTPFATTEAASVRWNTSPTLAVFLLSFSIIRTRNGVPAGI